MSIEFAKPPENICVLRLSAVGDVCHTLPVIRTIQARWPAARITWIIGRLEAQLIGDIPEIEFITFDKARGRRAYLDLRHTLRGRRFDLLLHMQMSLRASIASLAIKAPIRLGFDRERAHDMQWLFTNRRIQHRDRQHVMDSLFGFSEALGIEERVLRWDIPVPDAAAQFARETIAHDTPALLISPCANARFRNFRNWRAERYAAAADFAARELGMQVILTGGPSAIEHEYADAIVSAARTAPLDLVGKTSLKELFALIGRASALISPDSGPVHMGTAAGTPVIGLFATTNPDRAGPYLSRQWEVNRYPDAVARYIGEPVRSLRWGTRVRVPEAMDLVTVEDVCAQVRALSAAGFPRADN